jgi:hypothetical protein
MTDRSTRVARMEFLGGVRIEIGGSIVTPEADRLFALIVRLSVPLGRMTARQTITDTIWPGIDDASARHNLRQTIYKAREIGLVIESSDDALRLDPRFWSCDWDDAEGDVPGEWLSEYDPRFSEPLDRWVTAQREVVHAQLRPRIMRSLQAARAAGELAKADRYAVQLLGIDPLNEEATLTRAETLAMHGAKAQALALLDTYVRELGRHGGGEDASLPARLLRRRIAEKLPSIGYQGARGHAGPLVGRTREVQQLLAALFDMRAGRGGAVLVHGVDGLGKSRLLFELRKAAAVHGVSVLELACDATPAVMPFAVLRRLVERVLDFPGALGVSPEALSVLREWIASRAYAPDDCPLAEIEDLLAAVSEETPLMIQIEGAHLIDAESLGRLDRVYRRGGKRFHMLTLTSSTAATPTDNPVELQWITRLALRPMLTVEVRGVVESYAATSQPRATTDQIALASVFSEGVPMYGIEMLGLMLDEGSPDKIPFRVQVSVDRALRELSELQWRILALAWLLGEASTEEVIVHAIAAELSEYQAAFDQLEVCGYLTNSDGRWRASPLLATEATARLRGTVLRRDASRAARTLEKDWVANLDVANGLCALHLLVLAGSEDAAFRFLDREAGRLVLQARAADLVFALRKSRAVAKAPRLLDAIDFVVARVVHAAESTDGDSRHLATSRVSSIPPISNSSVDSVLREPSNPLVARAIRQSRDLRREPRLRLTDAVMALVIADNCNDPAAILSARAAIDSVRHARHVSAFDLCRADCISASIGGTREEATTAALRLAEASQSVADIGLACMGLRNASDCLLGFGNYASAKRLLQDALTLSTSLGYHGVTVTNAAAMADLAIVEVDAATAAEYIALAEDTAIEYSLRSHGLWIDIYDVRAWTLLVAGDRSAAAKAARQARKFAKHGSSDRLFELLTCTKLATRSGVLTDEIIRDCRVLMQRLGARRFNPTEERTMASLILASRGTRIESEVRARIDEVLPTIRARTGSSWGFLDSLIATCDGAAVD